jgi:hypothetical protein
MRLRQAPDCHKACVSVVMASDFSASGDRHSFCRAAAKWQIPDLRNHTLKYMYVNSTIIGREITFSFLQQDFKCHQG